MKSNYIFKIDLSNRNNFGQFHREAVKQFDDLKDALISLTEYRALEYKENIRYALGHNLP